MPRLIDPGGGDAIDLEQLFEVLDASDFDPRDQDAFAAMGPWLARLGRNRDFLADLAIAELEQRFAGQDANAYGAQVLLLRPPDGRFLLRANFWPARNDAAVRANGTAPFFYDLPHDHNFDFLTVGYLGPGYWSDYYEFGGDALGLPGEPANLTFVERSRLAESKAMLYRAHRDVHVQLPPDRFSVSLNILGYDFAQPWRSQYRFAITIAEALVTLAAQFGGDRGIGLPREYALLLHLVRHAGATRTRADLLAAVWGLNFDPGTNLIEVHVSRLRAKLDRGFDAAMLVTEKGRGYRLVSTVEA